MDPKKVTREIPSSSIAAIVPAAGSGKRFGSEENKLFARLAGQPIWFRSIERLRSCTKMGRIVMAVSVADRARIQAEFSQQIAELGVELVAGGSERSDSVKNALDLLTNDSAIRLVAIHDAARPLVRPEDLEAVFREATRSGAALLAAPISGTVKRETQSGIQTVERRDLHIALTPQVFQIDVLTEAYARHRGRAATDDAELVQRFGHAVQLVRGSADNLKITYPEDLAVAEALWASQQTQVRNDSPE